MTASGKMRILISTDFEQSGFFCPDTFCIADVIVRTVEGRHYSIVNVSMLVPSESADEMILGLLGGRTEMSFAEISGLPDANPGDLPTDKDN